MRKQKPTGPKHIAPYVKLVNEKAGTQPWFDPRAKQLPHFPSTTYAFRKFLTPSQVPPLQMASEATHPNILWPPHL